MAQGFFIVFEGGEGSGKSTQIRALVRWLRGQGRPVVVTRQPGGTPLGKGIRRLLLHTEQVVSPRAELLLYEADRAQHADEFLAPALKAGKIVVSDRFSDSSTVYQGMCRGLGAERVRRFNEFATGGIQPDLVIVLDIPEGVGSRRVGQRRKRDRIEREALAFHRKVRQGFLTLAKQSPRRFAVLDGKRDRRALALEIRALVEKRL